MTEYKIVSTEYGESLIRTDYDGSIWFIPIDPANSDYQRYLRHLAGEDESGTLSQDYVI